jgi:hypothetical protein
MRDKALEDLAEKAAFAKGRKTEQSGGRAGENRNA